MNVELPEGYIPLTDDERARLQNDRYPVGPTPRVLREMRENEAMDAAHVKYRSPGRRLLADELRGYQAAEPKDPLYRRLLGVYVRATARIATLPPQARGLRKLAETKQRVARGLMKKRLDELAVPVVSHSPTL